MPTMPTTTASETRLKNLFERSLDGDQLAYREFLTAIGDLLRRYVQRQLYRFDRSAPDAEDIVQEVLLAIHAKRHVYDRDVPITAWAHAIARYKMIDYLRATGRSARDISLDEIEDLPADSGSQIDIVLSLGNLLAGLPDRFRRPIELVKINGFSTKEAAAATNTSEASVRVNVHRGLKSLLRSLE